VTAAVSEDQALALQACVGRGGVAVFPSDTVYGICCDPEDAAAAARLYELKGRPASRAAAVMFFVLEAALQALPDLAQAERAALTALLPGPVTLLLANPAEGFRAACAADPSTLGLRVPRLPDRLAALGGVRLPVMQSSANISGEPEARRLADVPRRLREGADLVIDGGELPGRPSTVIDLRPFAGAGAWRVLREGAMPAAQVERRLSALI
jgi:L-threonylcarbamoyladenylate synthase